MMMDILINVVIATELALISLLVFKTYRLSKLDEESKSQEGESESEVDDTQGLSSAQEFAIDQLLNFQIERKIAQGKTSEPINEAVSLYLIGAMQFIGNQCHCNAESVRALTAKILKSQLKLTPIALGKYFSIAAKQLPETNYGSLILAGENAARAWLDKHAVPETECLKTRVDDHLMAA